MLRINLLPSYVAARRLNKKLSAGFIVGFVAVVAALLAFQFLMLVPAKNNETTLANAAVQAHTEITNLGTQATTILSGIAPIQAKLDFFTAVQAYNLQYIKLYEMVARFTNPKILVTGMQVSGSTLTINAYTPSIAELGRYLQYMYHEPDISSVSISSIPAPDQASETLYEYKGQVIGVTGGAAATSSPSGGPGGMRQPGQGGMGGMSQGPGMGMSGGTQASGIPGVPPGVSVTLPAGVTIPGSENSSAGSPGGLQGSGQYGGGMPNSSGLPNLSPMGQQSSYGNRPPGYGGQGQQPGRMGGSGGQGGAGDTIYETIMSDPSFNPKYWKIITKRTDGFTFVATCTLKTTFTPPTPPGGSGAPAAGGYGMGAPGGGMQGPPAAMMRPPGPQRSNSSQ